MTGFDIVKATFWSDSPHGVQPPLTAEAVAEAEQALGVRLPEALLELLQTQNGGVVNDAWDAFATSAPTSWSADHVPFDDLFGIGRTDGYLSLLDSPYLVGEWGLPEPVVLLSGDGHTWIALDYRACGPHGEPSVTWFDQDLNQEVPLADSFRSFVEGLTDSSELPSVRALNDMAIEWVVWRQDDNGNRYEVARHETRDQAQAIADAMEERGHRQTYWVAAHFQQASG